MWLVCVALAQQSSFKAVNAIGRFFHCYYYENLGRIMHNLIFAILCSVAVSVLLKVARKKNIIIEQAIAFNYIVAISLSYFLLKPDFKGLEFTEYLAQGDSTPIFLALGILLPTVFIIMSKAVEFAGIVRSDAAQRLSLFLPIVASFIIFHETLSQPKNRWDYFGIHWFILHFEQIE